MEYLSLELQRLLTNLFQFVAAFLIAFPVAWEREHSTRIMGLRTFPLVAVASCGYVLMAIAVLGESGDAHGRIIQGLMTGLGFIGGGAILKGNGSVQGTATAASIWTTGIVGAAVGYGSYELAIIISLVNFLTLRLLTPRNLTADATATVDEPEGQEFLSEE